MVCKELEWQLSMWDKLPRVLFQIFPMEDLLYRITKDELNKRKKVPGQIVQESLSEYFVRFDEKN